jgi:hypothetical protein
MKAEFPTEGYDCSCGVKGCKRWLWNCQVTYDKSISRLKAQRSRCCDGSRVLNATTNAEVSTFSTYLSFVPSVHRACLGRCCGIFKEPVLLTTRLL